MSYALKQSQTARVLLFYMVDSADHISGKTGLSPTVTISKNGAAFGAVAGAVSEISAGWYKVAGNATDSNTLGPLALHATAGGADPTDCLFEVVAYDPEDAAGLGLSRLDAAVTSRLAPTTAGRTLDVAATGEAGLDFDNIKDASGAHTLTNITVPTVTNLTNAPPDEAGVTTLLSRLTGTRATNLDNLDAAISTRAAPGDILQTVGNTINVDSNHCVVARSVDSGLSRSATAQAGAAGTITLDAGASAIDDFYVGQRVRLHAGSGIGQTRLITAYNGTTKVATVARNWKTNPDNTTTFAIYADDLSYLDVAISTLNNKLGAITGSGLNTVLGFFRALAAKAAALTGTDLSTGTTFDNVTDSQEAIVDNAGGGAGGATAAQVWAYADRTLTMSAAQLQAAATGAALIWQRGDTISQPITGLGTLASRTKLYVTAKLDPDDADTAAVFKIEETAGLQILNGAAAGTPAQGDITVDDATAGDITITLDEAASVLLPTGTALYVTVKQITAAGAFTELSTTLLLQPAGCQAIA